VMPVFCADGVSRPLFGCG